MDRKRIISVFSTALMLALCVLTVLLEMLDLNYSRNVIHNRLLKSSIPLVPGVVAVWILVKKLGFRLFGKAENLLYLLPCLCVAINNFQFCSFFAGNMRLQEGVDAFAWILFAGNCLLTGFFEELIFRGIVFPLVLERVSNNKKGLFLAVLLSSAIFGLSHLLNIVMGAGVGATILQVGYSTLTGGMFAFAFIKTKNVIFCVLLHAVYNFGGLLFTPLQGLGTGVLFDVGTTVMMAVVAIAVGAFVVYKIYKYSDEERIALYQRLGVKPKND